MADSVSAAPVDSFTLTLRFGAQRTVVHHHASATVDELIESLSQAGGGFKLSDTLHLHGDRLWKTGSRPDGDGLGEGGLGVAAGRLSLVAVGRRGSAPRIVRPSAPGEGAELLRDVVGSGGELLLGVRSRSVASTCERHGRPWYGREAFELPLAGRTLSVTQTPATGTTGGSVWGAGASLSRLVHSAFFPRSMWADKVVLELGAGTGIVGLAVSLLDPPPRRVTLTDVAGALSLLRRNVRKNGSEGVCSVDELSWECVPPVSTTPAPAAWRADVIVGSDLLYWQEPYGPIVQCLSWLLSAAGGGAQECWYMHEWRSSQRELAVIDSLGRAGLSVAQVPTSEYAPYLQLNGEGAASADLRERHHALFRIRAGQP